MKLFFLQIDESMFNPLTLIGILVISFVIGIIITRAIFSIPTFLKHQKMQTLLLIKIAKAQGVSEKEIEIISEILEPDPTKISSVTEGKSILKIDKLHLESESSNNPK